MRRVLLMASIMLLGLSWAVAQSSSTPSSYPDGAQQGAGQDSTATAASSGRQSHTGAGGQMTVEGCLSGSDGNFTLMAKDGTSYQLTGDTATLSEHVGHEVKVTGMSSSGGSGSSASANGGASAGGSGQTLQVSSVKHVSKTCKSGGMSH